jgi:hypothetical protein
MMFFSFNKFVLGCLFATVVFTLPEGDALPSGFIAGKDFDFCYRWVLILYFELLRSHFLSIESMTEPVTSKNAISGVFAKNPRNDWRPMLLLVNKDGTVSVLEDPDKSPHSFVILELEEEICTNVERGLQSIAVHPDFEENRYIYLYYNKYKEECLADDSEDGPWNVVSRFVMDPKTLKLDFSEREEIWR